MFTTTWLAMALAGTCEGFIGPFATGGWTASSGAGWSVDEVDGTASLAYVVPDAPAPNSTFEVTVSVSDVDELTVDWSYTYNHGFFDTEASLEFMLDGDSQFLHEGNGVAFEGLQVHSGSVTIDARGAALLTFRVEGDNYDGSVGLSGELQLSNLRFDSDRCDCAGAFDGDATEDECGVCDADPTNDCTLDCDGVWGGLAYVDDCGDCVGGTTGESPCAPDTADTGAADTGATDTADTADTGAADTADTGAADTGAADTAGHYGTTSPTTDPTAPQSTTSPPQLPTAADGCACQQQRPSIAWAWLARR